MKIGYDGRFLSQDESGNGVFTRCLIEQLIRIDDDNRYVAYLTHANTLQEGKNLKIRKMPSLHRNPHLRLLVTFPLEFARRPVDIFHTFYSIPIQVPAKVVLTLVEFFWFTNPERLPLSWFFQTQLRLITRYAINRADALIVPTCYVRDRLTAYFNIPNGKISVIPLGLNDFFQQSPDPTEISDVKTKYKLDRKYILTVGDLHKRKNFEALIDVFNRLKEKRGFRYQLVIAGKPYKDSQALLSKVADSKFSQDIRITKYLPIHHLRALYWGADLFVLPSLDEGFGLTTHEAMACGTPVVCSNRGALPEVVGDAGLFFDPMNPEEMEETIAQTLEDVPLQRELIRKGFKRIAYFSWEKIARETLNIYEKLSADD
jgi:glycosyltransferase involved in cell wall biosynthesis